jgi:hypothetical protein
MQRRKKIPGKLKLIWCDVSAFFILKVPIKPGLGKKGNFKGCKN